MQPDCRSGSAKPVLGPSAALTVSLVAALHRVFGLHQQLEEIHRVAQIAHCVSQGKIGSGFDVYTATYGTCIYQRFPAAFLEAVVVGGETQPSSLRLSALEEVLKPCSRVGPKAILHGSSEGASDDAGRHSLWWHANSRHGIESDGVA